MATFKHNKGFTLIEMVVVIVVIGVIMSGTAVYITNGVRAYTNTANRDQLTSLGRITVERVARELRTALPNSIRVSNNCIEFFPIQGGSVYLNLPVTNAATSFNAVSVTTPSGFGTLYIVVYPYNSATLYSLSNPGAIAQLTSISGAPTATVTLANAHRFITHAPQRRFFIVSSPVSFCLVGTSLYRYSGYTISNSQTAPPNTGAALLAENIQTTDNATTVVPFTYAPGTLQRNGIVTLDFRFLQDGDWIRLSHEVQVRNVL